MAQPTLPNFLCIGAPKCGSTWLQFLLQSHPQIFIPSELNEIHFFDRYYDKGIEWYKHFFKNAPTESVIGEVTPHYLYIDEVSKIKNLDKIKKLILIFRDPVARCISHYKFRIRQDNYQKSFSTFIKEYPESVEWGLYAKYLERYLQYYSKSQILILCFETAVKDVENTKKILGSFLQISSDGFSNSSGLEKVNEGFVPKHRRLYSLSVQLSSIMLKVGLFHLRNIIKSNKIVKKLLFNKSETTSNLIVEKETVDWLTKYYKNDQDRLAEIIAMQ